MLGLPPHGWAHLALISGGENIYLGSRLVILIYPALSATIGGGDGMDADRANWMTLLFWEVPSIWALGCCWAHCARFFLEKKDPLLVIVYLHTINYVLYVGGWQEWVDGSG